MIIYYAATTIISLICLFISVFTFKPKRINYHFIPLMIVITITTAGYLALAVSQTLSEAVLAIKIALLGSCFVAPMVLFMECTICMIKVPKALKNIIYLYCFVMYGLVLSIGYSDIYYTDLALGKVGDVTVLLHKAGISIIFYYTMMVAFIVMQLVVIIYSFIRKNEVSRKNLFACVIMVANSIIFFILRSVNAFEFEVLPLACTVNAIILVYILRRVIMYSIEDNILHYLRKQNTYSYIVLDKSLNYIGSSKTALEIFPEIKDCVVDKKIDAIPSLRIILSWVRDFITGSLKTITYESQDKHYVCNVEMVKYKGMHCGYVVQLREDTDGWNYMKLLSIHNNELQKFQDELEEKVLEQTGEIRNKNKKIKELYLQTITALSEAVDAKDRYTSGHSRRVAEYARMLAEKMGKDKSEQEKIYRAGLLHDVGKIRIPVEIINKPARLTDEEYNTIKIHSVTGFHILRGISDDNYIAIAAKHHHERYDGRGYPNGLSGEMIPEIARILGVADAYDAMTSDRSYRTKLTQDVVRNEIVKGRGTQFDPEVADCMLEIIDADKDFELRQKDSLFKRVLVIDDEPINNKLVTHIMHDEPMYEIVSALSGEEAVDMVKHQPFDLILLDVRMPGMDGFETFELIRKECHTPVAFMTGDKDIDMSEKFAQLGCEEYITKPFLPLLIKEVIHNMTNRISVEE